MADTLGLNRPRQTGLQFPPPHDHRQGRLPVLDTSAVDRLLVAGVWVPIKKGSLTALTGVRPPFGHDVNPMFAFTTPNGVQAAIFASAIQGWSPLEIPGGD